MSGTLAVLLLLALVALFFSMRRGRRSTAQDFAPDSFPQAPPPAVKPLALHEDVQFTVFRPQEVQPERWYPLLAFAHLSQRSPDAPRDSADPLAEVERQARGVLGDQVRAFAQMRQDSAQAVPDEAEVTFVPEIPGFRVEPAARTFRWIDSVHREEFQVRAGAGLDGQVARGQLSVFLGRILLAQVPLAIRVNSAASPVAVEPTAMAPVLPFRRIFASYSHRDEAVVAELERYAGTLGDRYLRDVRDLRAGEVWSRRLEELIEKADVFQLFWSWNALRSPFVEQEWRYALGLGRPNFVRPTYWEEPLPEDPANELPPADLRRVQFHLLRGGTGSLPPAPLGVEAAPPVPSAIAPKRSGSKVGLALGTALVTVIGVGLLVGRQASVPSPLPLDPGPTPTPVESRPTISERQQDPAPVSSIAKSREVPKAHPAPPTPGPRRPPPRLPSQKPPLPIDVRPTVPAHLPPTSPPTPPPDPVEALGPERLRRIDEALSTAGRLAERARAAYGVTNPGGSIGDRLDRFVDETSDLLRALRAERGLTGAWKRDARSLLALGSEIDRLSASEPLSGTTGVLWQEIRRQLEILDGEIG